MGSQVSQPVIVEQVRPGLYCCRWRMAESVRDFRCYANAFKLRGRRPNSYSITATWIEKKYTVIVEASRESVQKSSQPETAKLFSIGEDELDTDATLSAREEKRRDLPQSVWISYGGGQNQILPELAPGVWRTNDFQFNTSLGQRSLPYRVMTGRPWAGCGLTFRLWMDFQTTSRGERTALRHFSDAFNNQSYCDVQFELGSETIGAHVAVLSARSSVFSAMFHNDMQESNTRRVVISDIEPPVFKQLLHYMYAGKAPDLQLLADEMAQPLLLAADKYDVQDLKDECQALMRSRLTVDNAFDILVWAHYHSVTRLTEAALTFVAECDEETCAAQSDLEEMNKVCPELCNLITNKRTLMNNPSLCLC
ncbi:hypothetical protein OUZ56_015256 [Daphnia magna]|uniref:BTB domain-containing protein n=1 Tax=Daphnia magna TaxID=35525 RepID=A0ABR0AMA0_9CRUS|nr:hypothetical protein OUZ56_015256 [Daphnia magna]